MTLLTFDSCETLLLAVTGGLLLIQLLYQAGFYLRIPRRQKREKKRNEASSADYPPLSVILYAHEACAQLKANLTAVLEQDYPTFEVIVITDGTDDGTADYLTQLESRCPHLYHSFVPDSSRYISHKKLGLTLGIRAAKHDWLVLTDPDCRPASDQWLRLLSRRFRPGTDVVLGYCGYASGRGWLQRCAAYDALLLGMRYLGAAIGRQPYMGLGGNLAYRKEAFFRQKGFSAHLNLLRGDDDLFVNSVVTGRNTQVETDARATVRRPPCMRAKDWREEKISRASTARLYRGWARYVLGFDTLTRLLFHAAWITTLCIGLVRGQWFVAGLAVLAFLVCWTVQAYAIRRTARALGEERRYLFSLPIFDLLHPLQSLRWRLVCRMRGKGEFMRR